MFSSPYQPARVGAGDRQWSVAVASRRGVAWSIFGRPSVRNKERLEQRLLQPFRWVCARTALPKSGAQSLDRSDVGLNERRYQLHHVRGHSTGRGFPCWAHALKPPSLPVVPTSQARLPAPTQQWPSQPVGCRCRHPTHRVHDGRITRSTACSLSRAYSSCHEFCAAEDGEQVALRLSRDVPFPGFP